MALASRDSKTVDSLLAKTFDEWSEGFLRETTGIDEVRRVNLLVAKLGNFTKGLITTNEVASAEAVIKDISKQIKGIREVERGRKRRVTGNIVGREREAMSCTWCGRKGHVSRYCWARREQERKNIKGLNEGVMNLNLDNL